MTAVSQVKVLRDRGGDWDVWIDEGAENYTGCCIGTSGTKAVAIGNAIRELTERIEELRVQHVRALMGLPE